ncbi:MAG: KAP family NTPase [Oligoflexia bacterium]|nr:KAP family NTPase [Oligoflexia bacterium]
MREDDPLKLYSQVFNNFLEQDRRRTLLLKGEWGVGKTHFYNEFVKTYQATHVEDKRPFCYVSLFGLSTIEELKAQIIASAGKMRGGIGTAADVIGKFLEGSFSVSVPAIATNALEERLLTGCVVCLDDLERKRPELTLDSVFGFVDRLATLRSCHVILVVNDGELKEEIDTLKRYRDKVIDSEITFAPSLDRNLSVVFGGDKNPEVVKQVRGSLERLEKRNIRTIKRIEWMLNDFQFLLTDQDKEIQAQLVEQISTHCILHFEFGDILVPEKLLGAHWMAMKVAERLDRKYKKRSGDGSEEEESDPMSELIYKSKYIGHDLDAVFLQYLKDGFVNRDECDSVIAQWKENKARLNIRGKMEKLRDMAWGSYGVSQDTLLAGMKEFLDEHIYDLQVQEYNNHLLFILKLNPQFDRAAYDLKYAEKTVEKANLEELQQLSILNLPDNFSEKIEAKRAQLLKQHSIPELLGRLCQGDSWHTKDLMFLNSYSADELKNYFTDAQNENSATELAIIADRLTNPMEGFQSELARKLSSILTEFAARSELDKMRTEKAVARIEKYLNQVVL